MTLEANLATEVGIIVLDVIGVYMNKFKEKLEDNGGDNTKVRFMIGRWGRPLSNISVYISSGLVVNVYSNCHKWLFP